MSGATPKEAIRPTYETNMTQHKPELYNKCVREASIPLFSPPAPLS